MFIILPNEVLTFYGVSFSFGLTIEAVYNRRPHKKMIISMLKGMENTQNIPLTSLHLPDLVEIRSSKIIYFGTIVIVSTRLCGNFVRDVTCIHNLPERLRGMRNAERWSKMHVGAHLYLKSNEYYKDSQEQLVINVHFTFLWVTNSASLKRGSIDSLLCTQDKTQLQTRLGTAVKEA